MKKVALHWLSAVAGLAVIISLVGASSALADNDRGNGKSNDDKNEHSRQEIKDVGSTLEIHISDNGKTLVRGAKVTAVGSTTITAVNTWGSTTVTWMVNVDGNTKFVKKSGSTAGIADVKVGDIVSFDGNLVTTAGVLTVQAKTVKDWSLIQQQKAPLTLQGTLKSVASTTVPTSFVLTVGGVDYTVSVSATTAVLNNLWLTTALTNFHVGDTVRVYGLVDVTAHTINATVVRDTSISI